jgi:transcription elongation factor Elf1
MGIDRGTNKAPPSPALTTFAFCDNRAIRLAVNLHCPRCSAELTAADVGADRCGSVVLVCGACGFNVLTVS